MFYNTLEQFNIIMMEIAKIIEKNISLDILRQNIFPNRPEEAAMFGCESVSTKNIISVLFHREPSKFSYVFTEIDCFEGIIKLRVREGSHPYQALPRIVAYTLSSHPKRSYTDCIANPQ